MKMIFTLLRCWNSVLKSVGVRLSLQLVFLGTVVSAQEVFTYDSLYEVKDGLVGEANFQYVTDREGIPLKQGAFSFRTQRSDTACSTSLTEMMWSGSYADNRKNGPWVYTELNQNVQVLGYIDTFKVSTKLFTVVEQIRGSFADGVPDGNWSLSEQFFENGRSTEREAYALLTLSEAKASGTFTASGTDQDGKAYRIQGDAKDGLMTGVWSLEFVVDGTPVREVRDYVKGFLRSLIRTNPSSGDTLTAVEFPLSKDILKVINGERTSPKPANMPLSLNFSDGYARSSYFFAVQSIGNKLINDVLKHLFKNDEDVYMTNGLPLGTNRLIYPLSRSEEELLNGWAEMLSSYEESVMRLATLQDEYARFADNDTLEHIHRYTAAQAQVLERIAPWSRSFANKEIEFYDRKGMLLNHAAEMLLTDTLVESGGVRTISFGVEAIDAGLLQFVTDNIKQRTVYADSLESLYQDVIKGLSLDESIASLASRIEGVLTSTIALLTDTGIESRSMPFADRMRTEFVDQQLREAVSRFQDFNESREIQREFGDSIITAFEQIDGMIEVVGRIYRRADAIDTLFTEYIFDPYTFNDKFPSRIKKRLYVFVAEETFSMIMDEAIRSGNAIIMRSWLDRAEAIQRMLVNKLNEDTSRLERRIRSKMTLDQRLELLGID